jgi:hypothetical protein
MSTVSVMTMRHVFRRNRVVVFTMHAGRRRHIGRPDVVAHPIPGSAGRGAVAPRTVAFAGPKAKFFADAGTPDSVVSVAFRSCARHADEEHVAACFSNMSCEESGGVIHDCFRKSLVPQGFHGFVLFSCQILFGRLDVHVPISVITPGTLPQRVFGWFGTG